MSTDLMLDVGQANELKLAFRRANLSKSDIKRLCEGSILADVRRVLRGLASIKMEENIIDCNASPFVPPGWSIKKHRKSVPFKWDASKVELFTVENQDRHYGDVVGNMLAKKPVLNANVLDYLLAHPEIIPDEWKGKYIYFWGTVYSNRISGDSHVRCLYYSNSGVGRWCGDDTGFGYKLDRDCPAALLRAS